MHVKFMHVVCLRSHLQMVKVTRITNDELEKITEANKIFQDVQTATKLQ